MTSLGSSNTALADRPSSRLSDLWLQILQAVEPQLQRSAFITWFKDTAILSCDDGTLVVGLPLPMSLNWHMEHYRTLTIDTAKAIDPRIHTVVYKVDGGLKDNRERTVDLLQHFPEQRKRKLPGKNEIRMAEGIVSKILNPQYMLENFVVGSGNRLAHAACQAVALSPGGKYNPLFLYGGVGLGKTHLLQATVNAIFKQMPKAAIVYTTTEDFTNHVVEAIRSQKMEKLRNRYRQIDVLIIDDVQFLANKERTQEEFFHTFNALYEERKQIIISADRPPQELQLEDRLISRFARGMIADVSMPDYETRLAILVEKAREYELFLDRKVLEFIAENVQSNVRELEGILMQAIAQYELEQRMPTVASIAQILRKVGRGPSEEGVSTAPVGFQEPPARRHVTMQEVMEAVSGYYSVSIQDMTGASRVRDVLVPRHIVMYLGKKHARTSFVRIGEVLGNRDHTTVMHACDKIERKIHDDPQLLREVRAIEKDLNVTQPAV